MARCKRILCLLLALSIFPLPFPFVGSLTNAAPRFVHNSAIDANDEAGDETKGLKLRLSEGAEETKREAPINKPQSSPLSDADAQNVLRRLPPIKMEASDEQNFARRENSLPPPRTGKVINASFPPPEESTRAANDNPLARYLEVTRHAPEGEVPLAPQLSVTFSQPMVAVTSQTDAVMENLPVQLTPQPQGKWRWVGTKTLLFEPAERFPMATEYRVIVPAGTKSANGERIAKPATWNFSTPPLNIKKSYPEGTSNRRDALMFVEFDQRIDPAAVLRYTRVKAGTKELPTRLATASEVEADEALRDLVKAAPKDRWLAFRAVDPTINDTRLALPADASVSVNILPGAPSAEGARKTDKEQSFSFRTYGALRVTDHDCEYEKQCSPFNDWSITFSNQLDADAFQASSVRVEPQIQNFKTNVYGSTLNIHGIKKAHIVYKVTLDKSITDQFGQTLGEDQTFAFNVGAASPALATSGEGFVVLDPANSPPKFSIYSLNYTELKVSLYSVTPEDWDKYVHYMRYIFNYHETIKHIPAIQKQGDPPGRLIYAKRIEIKTKPDEMTETLIDLAPALNNHLGQALVIVEPITPFNNRERSVLASWVQATNIGLDAFVDNTNLIGWATSLKDGAPLAGVELSLLPNGNTSASGTDGLARLALKSSKADGNLNLLVARKGNDVAILPEHFDWYNTAGGWHKKALTDSLRWYVFDDRKLYRPGEEAHIKGWIRRVGGGTSGDVGALSGAASGVDYVLKDAQDNEITKGTLRLNVFGGFDTVVKLPQTMNLGQATLELEARGHKKEFEDQTHSHRFQVQEFRRPEFEVTAETSEGTHFVGGHAEAIVNAKYYAGGALPDTEVTWQVTSAPASFAPPNRSDFTFGRWIAWWREPDDSNDSHTEEFKGRTDAFGKHHLRIDFDSITPPHATNVFAAASVQDVNRQTLNASATMLVHPADLYVGLRSERTFVQQGEPLTVQAIVTDLEGVAVPHRQIKMRAVLLDWVYEKGEWKQKEKNAQECAVVSASDVVKCTFNPKEGGTYRVNASIMDELERRNESELTLWVAGGKREPQRDVKQEEIELIPDRKEYKAGDVAKVLVQAPFYPAEGVLTLRRSGIVKTTHFRMDTASLTLKVPIEEAHTPNIHAQVDLVGAATRTNDEGVPNEQLPKRPAYASGELNLNVPPLARKLNVQAVPRDKTLAPSAQTFVDVTVRDAAGQFVKNSEVAVVVVDESVLALTDYKLADPLSIFYAERDAETNDYHSREKVLLANPEDLDERQVATRTELVASADAAAPSMDSLSTSSSMAVMVTASAPPPKSPAQNNSDRQAIRLRNNFNALAVFAASVPTNANGRAQVSVKLPDNLTRYRVMAVAVAGGKQFGTGESAITARKPLMVRPSAPRFLNFGDHFELPVVVQNQTDVPLSVNVAVRAGNASLTNGAGRRVNVPANDRVEVRFPAAAARAGTARFQIAATSGRFSDAAEIELPVWTPATTEAFATYGEIDDVGISQPVKLPSGVVKEYGGLDIETSSTQLQELTDAVLYLVHYPYECAEQISSRVMSVAALRDVLTAFKAKDLPTPETMKASVASDIKRLQGLQNEDGGYAFWRSGDDSWPYVSIHVAHALTRAKEKGFDVPADMLEASKKYLREIEQHIPSTYNVDARRALISYALYVRNRTGDKDAARARKLIAEAGLDHLSLESVGWLLPVLSNDPNSQMEVANIRRHLNNRATEEAATAHFASSYSDNDYLLLNSERRADGVILEALIGDQPQSDLIPKIVRGLLAHRTRGRWENTQENAFVLLALDRYFATYEKATPNMIARVWLGERFAGEQQFRGRTTDRQQINVPMRYLAEQQQQGATQNLVLSKNGAGRLYYRIGMKYAPASLKLDAADYGFAVERVYEAIDNPADVRRDENGAWHIKAGARVRVHLTMAASARRYHVALVDPLPAGLEALNPLLATTGSIPQAKQPEARTTHGYDYWWQRSWFEHQNLRDERAEAFTSLLWEGVYTYSYAARATTPGVFVVPPSKAEEMYHPETFGRGATDRVIVE